MSEPVPVILCGKTDVVGKTVIQALLPEFEIIRFVLTLEAGIAEIPSLLSGKALAKSDNIGSQNYSKTAAAVIMGAGYDDEAADRMREACKGSGDGVPWLRPDLSIPRPPPGSAYGKALAERIKVLMKELEEGGQMGKDGVHFY